jgi:hypothetical protein
MTLNIVDADMRNLVNASRSGRSRSPETVQLIEAIRELRPGKAKAIIPSDNETIARLQARLRAAARADNARLRIVTDGERILFALRDRSDGDPRGGVTQRREAVQRKALEMARSGRRSFSAEDLLDELESEGVPFHAARPATAAGAILRSMPEFKRSGRNRFEYRGERARS